jgi:hypothetical protein
VASLLVIGGVATGCGNGEANPESGAAKRGSDEKPPRGDPSSGAGDSLKEPVRGSEADIPPPPPLAVAARRLGDRVIIDYRLGPLPRSRARRPYTILTSVDPVGGRYPPLTIRSRVRSIKGRVNHSLGRVNKPPFRVLVSAEAKNGLRSRIVSVPLR